ncbi:hypothetical protein GYMLUDRAFT_931068 [Collybiopsis luxurians FD-317 M1]|nr:hypothetical protein GYMLUDRAFT_931068 [Collybiopsis luxurians FD-317 M1]
MRARLVARSSDSNQHAHWVSGTFYFGGVASTRKCGTSPSREWLIQGNLAAVEKLYPVRIQYDTPIIYLHS